MSLLDYRSDSLVLTAASEYCFANLFYNFLFDYGSELSLPATTLSKGCYYGMFAEADMYNNYLTLVGGLPAMNLAEECYAYMFYYPDDGYCPAINTLPATTLATRCYDHMFYNCYEISVSPTIKATTVAPYCCAYMFYNCGTANFHNVFSIPTATTLAEGCYSHMFENSYVGSGLNINLPATTLAQHCYEYMFYGVYQLYDNLPESLTIAADEIPEYACQYMFATESSFVRFPKKGCNQRKQSERLWMLWNVSGHRL